MTENEIDEPQPTISEKIRFYLGLYGIGIGTFLFIRPACKMLEIKPVNSDQMWCILHRYDAERRYSRAGLFLIEAFNRAYVQESPLPRNCVNCDFSADHDEESTVCRHPEVTETLKEHTVRNFDPIPICCPIKFHIERDKIINAAYVESQQIFQQAKSERK